MTEEQAGADAGAWIAKRVADSNGWSVRVAELSAERDRAWQEASDAICTLKRVQTALLDLDTATSHPDVLAGAIRAWQECRKRHDRVAAAFHAAEVRHAEGVVAWKIAHAATAEALLVAGGLVSAGLPDEPGLAMFRSIVSGARREVMLIEARDVLP